MAKINSELKLRKSTGRKKSKSEKVVFGIAFSMFVL